MLKGIINLLKIVHMFDILYNLAVQLLYLHNYRDSDSSFDIGGVILR